MRLTQKQKDIMWEHFPLTFTHIQNLNPMAIGFALKAAGIDWKGNKEFGARIVQLKNEGVIECDGIYLVRRKPK